MQGGQLDFGAKQPGKSSEDDGDGDGNDGDGLQSHSNKQDFADLIEKDLLIEAKGVGVEEGRVADKHLVEENAKRPPVDCLVVPPGLRKVKVRPCIGFSH